jgi:flagellar biosynthesis/type III secretory pathway protein FliH
VSTTVQALSEALELLQQNETRWVGHAEENIAALAVMVARHIVQRELTTDPSFVQEIVERALAQYPVDQEITVRLNPTDLAACRAPIEANGPREIRWISDASIQRGGCLMEGRERILDGRIDTALERAYRNLGGIQA